MSKLRFSNGQLSEYTLVLANKELKHFGQLTGVSNIKYKRNANSANEISFTIHKELITANYVPNLKEYQEYIWNNLNDLMLVWVKEKDEYFQINTPIDDNSIDTVKNITGLSLCESELSQINIYTTEINTEADIARDNYYAKFPTVFYRNPDNVDDYDWDNKDDPDREKYKVYQTDENGNYVLDSNGIKIIDEEATYQKRRSILKSSSLMHRVLQKAPHYTIKHVDASLINIQRVFSIDGTSIYDFLIGDCEEQFNCIFIFNSAERSISIYDLYTVCNDCGERGDFIDECPKCHSKNLKYYGGDTGIFVDKNNLTDSINFTTDVDSIKNTFKLEAGDELMTATVRSLLQGGSDYIQYFPEWQKNQMPKDLRDKLKEYDTSYNSYTDEYQSLLSRLYDLTDEKTRLEYSMFPNTEDYPDLYTGTFKDAKTEAAKLTSATLSPVAMTTVPQISGDATSSINNAVKNYAKTLVMTGYVKVEIDDTEKPTFTYSSTTDSEGNKYGTWVGKLKITNYSNEEDIAYTNSLSIKIYDNYLEFVEQKVLKNIKDNDDDDGSVYDVLSIADLNKFKTALTAYNLNRLQSFYDAINSVLTVLTEMKISDKDNELYGVLYNPYYQKLLACGEEIKVREFQIEEVDKSINDISTRLTDIQKDLNIETSLGDYYPLFCSYKREDKYSNSNYISDGLNNSQLIERANQFIELAKQELQKSCEQQHSISANLYNLLAIEEFKPLIEYFEVNNWIRIKVDGILYKLRLISYAIDFDNLNNIEVEFSNVTKVFDPETQRNILIESVQSMATSYSTVSKQAESGNEVKKEVNSWLDSGLNSALVRIKNNDKEETLLDNNGLLSRSYDDITESYSDKQLRITHNILAFTDDNWNTVKTALGEHQYYFYENGELSTATGYGLTSDFVTSGHIFGTEMIGGKIYSTNYSESKGTGSILDLDNSNFNFGGKLILDEKDLFLKDGQIQGGSLLIGNKSSTYAEITSDGILNCKGANISGNSVFKGTLDGATGIFSGSLEAEEIYIRSGNATNPVSCEFHDGYLGMICNDVDTNQFAFFNISAVNDGEFLWIDMGITKEGDLLSGINITKECTSLRSGTKELYVDNEGIHTFGRIYTDDSIYSDANLWFAYNDISTSDRGILTYWADNKSHYILSLNSNKLNTGIGWAGSSTYSTTTTIRGRTCQVQNASGTSSLSDERLKKDFATMKNWEDFYQSLEPYAFRMKNGNSGRYHMGFKAQQVEEALLNNGLTTSDFAGLVKMKYVKDEDDAENTALYETLGIKEGDDEYSLIYTEFVALNTYMIQQLLGRIKELETQIEQLGI